MKSNYKPLGNYIQEVNVRNTALEVNLLLGVSIQKKLMPSIANTIGTNMGTYKIIKRNQFAYGPVTSRNGDKISIALMDEHDEAIVSQAYTPFEVIDTNELHPEYLMMWFRRPEFDRYARFMSHGSAREIFDWEEMCNTLLPIPHISKQREIVAEYNVIQNRIKLNNHLIQKLEETAQAIYKEWFVDFEFPITSVSHPELVSGSQTLPYKSSGGKMVWCEELEKEVPKNWELVFLDNVCEKLYGYPFDSNLFTIEPTRNIPLIRIRDILNGHSDVFTSEVVDSKYLLENGDLLIGMDGTFHMSIWYSGNAYLNQRVVRFKTLSNKLTNLQVLYSIKQQIIDFENNIQGTTVAHLSDKHIKEITFLVGEEWVQKLVTPFFLNLTKNIIIKKQENQKLTELKELLLSKLASV
jgi:type I restriction enzyme S subunit